MRSIHLSYPGQSTDAFDSSGFHVHYADGICEAVESFAPAVLTFQDQQLLGRPYAEVKKWLESIDDNIQPYDAGIQARSLGISLYAPNFSQEETPGALVEGVLIADRQYFDKQDAMLRAARLL